MRHTVNRIVVIRVRLFRLTRQGVHAKANAWHFGRTMLTRPIRSISRDVYVTKARHFRHVTPLTGRVIRVNTERQQNRFQVLVRRLFRDL